MGFIPVSASIDAYNFLLKPEYLMFKNYGSTRVDTKINHRKIRSPLSNLGILASGVLFYVSRA
jgi:hypothetical protein